MLKGDSHIDTAAQEHEERASDAQRLSSRRTFLSGSAKLLGGGALALGLGAVPAFAKGDDDDEDNKKQGGKKNNGSGVSDVDILNYALVLERLEYEFYRRYLNRFNEGKIEGASIFEGFGNKVRSQIYQNLKRIREHEETHVKTLITVIKSLGGKPVGGSTLGGQTEYDFGVTSVKEFVATAQVLEDTGVMAYDGAIAYIDKPGLQTASATIATVEARHASYLRLLNGEVPFPEPFDEPKAPRQVCELVDPFITKSPFNLEAFCESLPNKVITL